MKCEDSKDRIAAITTRIGTILSDYLTGMLQGAARSCFTSNTVIRLKHIAMRVPNTAEASIPDNDPHSNLIQVRSTVQRERKAPSYHLVRILRRQQQSHSHQGTRDEASPSICSEYIPALRKMVASHTDWNAGKQMRNNDL